MMWRWKAMHGLAWMVAWSILAVAGSASAGGLDAGEVPASAYGEGGVHDGDARVASRLIVDVEEVAPGESFQVGVAFELDEDWHIYWQNPGDAGLPTNIAWEGEGLRFGPLQWAAPGLYEEADGMIDTYGYEGEVVLFSEARVSSEVEGSVEVAAQVDYLACSNACVEGQSRLSREIEVGEERVEAGEVMAAYFEEALGRVPQRPEALALEARFHYGEPEGEEAETLAVVELVECDESGGDCRGVELSYERLEHAFYPDAYSEMDVETLAVADHPEAADGVVMKLSLSPDRGVGSGEAILSGVVELETADGRRLPVHLRDEVGLDDAGQIVFEETPAWMEVVDWSSGGEASSGGWGGSGAPASLWLILLMAFVGGMILNLMPCVFPVLALKVAAITRLAHEDRRSVVSHGMAYVVGIVASMMVLAAAVIGLRLAGTEVGWGFQFQQPHFLAGLLVILVLFALNLFGVFEVTVSSQKIHEKANEASGLRRSAWEGVLAVVLATPCSAPFLGTAVGFALTSSAPIIVAVFAMLGLGLAAPMVVLSLVPGWAKVLPKPGPWMDRLKVFLGFALMGTAIWVIWLLGRQAGVDAMGQLLMFGGLMAMAAWLYGLVQFGPWSPNKIAAVSVAAALVVGGAYLVFPIEGERQVAATHGEGIDWEPWSDEGVQEALDEGRPAFVNFTADWCLTCQVNEENAIETARVHEAVEAYDVAMFKADWTEADEDIREKLASHGRAAIPYYLVYSPRAPGEPESLSEIISARGLVEALEGAR